MIDDDLSAQPSSFASPTPEPVPPLPGDAASWSIWLQYQRLLDARARHAARLAAQAEYMAGQRAVVIAMDSQTWAIQSLADAIRMHAAESIKSLADAIGKHAAK